jgi:hypothetical protein
MLLSWHDVKGTAITSTLTVGDSSVLLPVQDGTECCAAGIKFVCIQLELDFTDLAIATTNLAPNIILQGEYCIQLPQSSINLVNGNQVNFRLTTWLGAADLCTLPSMEIKCNILNIMHQDGPFNFLAPSFNLSSCRIDSTAIHGELKLLVVCLASDTIHQTLFMVLIPGYSIEPHNALNHIWQCYINTEGRTVQLSAQVYYSTFLNAICSFYDFNEYPIDLGGFF